jgi:hypothetical protein
MPASVSTVPTTLMKTIHKAPCKSCKAAAPFTLARTLIFSTWLLSVLLAIPVQTLAFHQETSDSEQTAPQPGSNTKQSGDVRTVFMAVAEKDGTPMPNLKLEDFSVLENGEPQQPIELSSASSVPLAMCVMVDSTGSEVWNPSRHKELEILSRFFGTAITASDVALVVSFNEDSYRESGVTNNLSELRAGLGKIAKTPLHGSTAVYDSMYDCDEAMSKDLSKRKIILVLSDFVTTLAGTNLTRP